jgi:type III secretion protein C
MTRRLAALCVWGCCLAGAMAPAQAADIRWRAEEYKYTTVEPKDLRGFLREFAAQQGMAVSIDPEVKGELSGRYKLPPRELMEQIARTYGLVYYFDGSVLHIAPSTAVESDVIRLSEKTPAEFALTLERLGIADARYPLTVDPQGGIVKVSGPRRLVELVRQAASSADTRAPGSAAAPVTATKVYPLQFAFAEDYLVRSGGKDYRVQGLASVLRQIFGASVWRSAVGGAAMPAATTRKPSQPAQSSTTPALPLLQAGRRGEAPAGQEAGSGAAQSEEQMQTVGAPNVPTFTAEPRTNTVVVRDIPARLDAYEDLIRTLDQRPLLVELEVNIIDINGDDFAALGIDWKALGSDGSFEVGSGGRINSDITNPRGNTPDPSPLRNNERTLGGVQGAVFALLMGNRSQVIARISALEKDGRAKVQAQPRLMTLNNIEAVLESINTFYVPVQGFQDAQLFDINVGTSIRLTPSIVPGTPGPDKAGETSQLVRMLVRIEDGVLTEQVVGQLPLVQRSNIGTQALISDGATLLIAGYTQERTRSSKTAVPVLSNLPLLGALFRSTSTVTTRSEKLFMITPRVVQPTQTAIAKPAPLPSPPPVEREFWQ